MGERVGTRDESQARLEQISQGLHRLLALRAALTSFQLSLRALEGQVEEPESRRHLLAMWRPCQERLDRLLDVVAPVATWTGHIGLLRQEMEDSLIDEAYIPGALDELTAAFDQACEEALFQLGSGLGEVVAQLGQPDQVVEVDRLDRADQAEGADE